MGFFNINGSSGNSSDGVTQEQLDLKVDKVSGKGLSTNDYTTAEKTKLNGIANGANNYIHPSTHAPSIIAQDSSNRFVSDTEKSTWNSKADTTAVTTTTNGLMTSTDKAKLDGISSGANKYTHPSTHPASVIVQDENNRFVTDAEKTTWNAKASTSVATTTTSGLMASADKTKLDSLSNYTHPTNHPASIITQTATARFVTDTEKATWNGKADKTEATTTTLGLVKKCEEQADSTATTIEELIVDFNALLLKLKNAGLM